MLELMLLYYSLWDFTCSLVVVVVLFKIKNYLSYRPPGRVARRGAPTEAKPKEADGSGC